MFYDNFNQYISKGSNSDMEVFVSLLTFKGMNLFPNSGRKFFPLREACNMKGGKY